MRCAFRLVLMFTLLWCGLHLAEPAQAHGAATDAHAWTGIAVADADDCAPTGGTPAPEADHHCPMAPDLGVVPRVARSMLPAVPAMLTPARRLASRALAPPLQPPSA